jgi:DNA-binding HxlR family transcriptional regulator
MRTYGQYCAAAKTLDVVGDRWTLLIVRELLLRGPSRYTDLRDGLPGIATNLLADRLRELEDHGIVTREEAPPPIATTLIGLTARGEALRGVIEEMVRWGVPLMVEPSDGEAFRSHWLSMPADLFLTDRTPDEPPVTIGIVAGDYEIVLETAGGRVHSRSGTAKDPDAALSGSPQTVMGLLTGALSLAEARKLGLQYTGNTKTLRRIQPELPFEELAGIADAAAASEQA